MDNDNKELQEELNYLLGYKDNLVLINKIMKKAGKVVYQEDNYTEEFNTFWRFFVEKKEDIEPKYLIYIAPHYDSYENNPFRIIIHLTNN